MKWSEVNKKGDYKITYNYPFKINIGGWFSSDHSPLLQVHSKHTLPLLWHQHWSIWVSIERVEVALNHSWWHVKVVDQHGMSSICGIFISFLLPPPCVVVYLIDLRSVCDTVLYGLRYRLIKGRLRATKYCITRRQFESTHEIASLASDLRVVVVEWHGGCFIRSIGYKTIINYPMIMYVHAEQPRKTEERARWLHIQCLNIHFTLIIIIIINIDRPIWQFVFVQCHH